MNRDKPCFLKCNTLFLFFLLLSFYFIFYFRLFQGLTCLRWLNTVLRAVSDNSRDSACFTRYTEDDSQNLLIKIL